MAEARDKRAILRKAAEAGMDPFFDRDRDRRGIPTFEQATVEAHATLKGQWAPRQQEAFLSSLRRHAFPSLGGRRVDHIVVADIQATLEPIWSEKPDITGKVRHRITTVLNYAHSKGWRAAEAPGKSVSVGLAKRKAGGNYKAMRYADVPASVTNLNAASTTVGRAALLFTIFNAARSGENQERALVPHRSRATLVAQAGRIDDDAQAPHRDVECWYCCDCRTRFTAEKG